jgi:hypothetical protein
MRKEHVLQHTLSQTNITRELPKHSTPRIGENAMNEDITK